MTFWSENQRLPTSKDQGFQGIESAVRKGYWKDFGIWTWTDLLNKTFNLKKKQRGYYKGKNGLERAKHELIDFKNQYHRLPTTKDKQINGIRNAIYRKYWIGKEIGIKNWAELKKITFNHDSSSG